VRRLRRACYAPRSANLLYSGILFDSSCISSTLNRFCHLGRYQCHGISVEISAFYSKPLTTRPTVRVVWFKSEPNNARPVFVFVVHVLSCYAVSHVRITTNLNRLMCDADNDSELIYHLVRCFKCVVVVRCLFLIFQ
jgi:hypothetical protein